MIKAILHRFEVSNLSRCSKQFNQNLSGEVNGSWRFFNCMFDWRPQLNEGKQNEKPVPLHTKFYKKIVLIETQYLCWLRPAIQALVRMKKEVAKIRSLSRNTRCWDIDRQTNGTVQSLGQTNAQSFDIRQGALKNNAKVWN